MPATPLPVPGAVPPAHVPAAPMPKHDPAELLARYRRARDRRSPWEGHWRDCVAFTLPQRDGAVAPPEPGQRAAERIFDATAGDAAEQLAASLLAELTPPWSRWIGLAPGPGMDETEAARLAPRLAEAEAVLQGHFDRSNFAVEMLLQPVNAAQGRLDPARLRRYAGELDYVEGNDEAVLSLNGQRLVTASCWWDPAYGAPGRGDASVIAAVFLDAAGNAYLHRVAYMFHDPTSTGEVDEATQLCRQAAAFARALYLPSISLEVNGVGRFLPGLLRRELAAGGVPAAVREVTSRRPKDTRILEAFDAPLAAGALHAHDSVFASPFVQEMRDWRPGQAHARDDGLDAVAGCLASEPVRLPRLPSAGRRTWRPGSSGVRAPSEFDV